MLALISVATTAFQLPHAASLHAATRSGTINAVSSWYDDGKRLGPKKPDIVDTAVSAGAFRTLAAALGAAGLVDTMKSAGPFTVFAPTDAAFAKLPAGTVEELIKPENKAKLTDILTYHVVSGKVMASTVVTMDGAKVPTVNGAEITINVGTDGVMVDGAKVTTTDIECSNGVIHIIDSVILPTPKVWPAMGGSGAWHPMRGPWPKTPPREQWIPPAGWKPPSKPVTSWYDRGDRLSSGTVKPTTMKPDIVDTAVSAGAFKTLAAALGAAGLVDTMKSAGPFTVFAPTDAAFAKLPAGTVEELIKPENKAKLTDILTYHVVSGKVMASTVVTMDGAKVPTVNGAEITINVGTDGVMVDGAKVTTTDIECSNGVIHIIDSVILPAAKPAPAKMPAMAGAGPAAPAGFEWGAVY